MNARSSWSDDGRWLAYGHGSITLKDVDSGAVFPIGPGYTPVFAGNKLVYATLADVREVDPLTRATRQLLPHTLSDMQGGGGSWVGVKRPNLHWSDGTVTLSSGCGAVFGTSKGWTDGYGGARPGETPRAVIVNGVKVHGGDSVELRTPDGKTWTWRGVGYTTCIRTDGMNRTLAGPDAVWPVPVLGPDGSLWILERDGNDTHTRLWLREGVTADAILVSDTGPAGYPSICWRKDHFQVAWSGAHGIEHTTVSPDAPRFDLTAQPIVAIGRPMRLAFFEFTPAVLPSNADLVQVSTWEWSLMQGGRKVGVYVSGEPDGDLTALERSIAKVSGRGVPVYAYWPRALQGGRLPRGCDVTVVEGYQRKGETLAAFETGLRAAVRRCGRAAIACACYTSNATLSNDLTALVPVYARVAKDMPNVEDLLVFSGSGRPTGYQDHPEVHGLWRQLLAGIPSAPPLPSKPPTPKPPTPPAPVPPVERPAPMFPTDDELTDFTNRLEAKYRDELHRAPVATAVDPLGRGRWTYDYALHRQAGQSHNAAWDKVNFTINEIAGIPNP